MSSNPLNETEYLPNDETLLEAFKKDTVNRVNYIFSLYEMMNQDPLGVSSISLEGPWGSGKTFFVKMLIKLILAHTDSNAQENSNNNSPENSNKDLLDEFKNYSKSKVSKSKIFPMYYDAWKNDVMSSPLLSLVYSMCKQAGIEKDLGPDMEKTVKSIAVAATKIALKTVSFIPGIPDTSELVDPVCELFGTDSRFVPVIDTEELEKDINALINKVFEVKHNPLVIFIDELDRCKPTFAIQLLESIKHYFNNPKILFVFSVNIEELQHSIKCIYGQGFDATRYLDRFFNIRFNLPAVDPYDFLKKQFPKENADDVLSQMICTLAHIYNLQLRSLIKFKTQVRFIANYNFPEMAFESDYGYAILYWLFVPIAICLKFHNQSQFELFLSGKGFDTLSYLSKQNSLIIKKICIKYLKNDNESEVTFNLLSSLNQAYHAVFSKKTSTKIGKCLFEENCYKIFNDKVSLLG